MLKTYVRPKLKAKLIHNVFVSNVVLKYFTNLAAERSIISLVISIAIKNSQKKVYFC